MLIINPKFYEKLRSPWPVADTKVYYRVIKLLIVSKLRNFEVGTTR